MSADDCESPRLQQLQLEQLRQQTHSERGRRCISLEQAASHREQQLGMDTEIAEVRAAIVLAAEAVAGDSDVALRSACALCAAEGPIAAAEQREYAVVLPLSREEDAGMNHCFAAPRNPS